MTARMTQAAIQRAIAAAQACHLRVVGFTVARDGAVHVQTESVDAQKQNVQPATPKKWATR